jgi:hypothetical protein
MFGIIPLAAADPNSTPWNLFTVQQEAALGRELGAWVDARVTPFADLRFEKQLISISEKLLEAPLQTPLQPTIHPIAAAEAYALGLPGGTIYLSAGLVGQLRCEQDLAGLLAHELAHQELRQLTRRMSRAKRFSIHVALVAGDRGKATLLEGLQAIGLDPQPGAPLFHYSAEEEAEAMAAAAARLEQTGYASDAATQFHQRLRQSAGADAQRYLERHPAVDAHAVMVDAAGKAPATSCGSKRAFRKLANSMERISAKAPGLDQLLAWTAPTVAPQVARSRERLINRSYAFDYPGTWSAANPGPNETVEVAPKDGRWQPGGQAPRLTLGLLAGTLEPFEDDLTGNATLLRHLVTLRPGLTADATLPAPAPNAPQVYALYFTGRSPAGGEERVWALYRRLPESVFYLLLIAPADQFDARLAEFQAIAASIEFSGPPTPGQTAAQRQEGANP